MKSSTIAWIIAGVGFTNYTDIIDRYLFGTNEEE